MEDYQSYLTAWYIYLAITALLFVLVWLPTAKLPWRNLAWALRISVPIVCLVPWQGTDPEVYYAPAFIVAAFEFIDSGMAPITTSGVWEIVQPILWLLLLNAVVWSLKAIYDVFWLRYKKPSDQPGGTDIEGERVDPTIS